MYRFIIVLLIVSFISVPVIAETTISLELYPNRMNNIFDSPNLYNSNEWFATTVKVEKTFFDHLNICFNIKTFLFGTNGLSYYPSSVKFTNSISYSWKQFKVKYQHYCHHYFKQFKNRYNDSDKLIFKYSF